MVKSIKTKKTKKTKKIKKQINNILLPNGNDIEYSKIPNTIKCCKCNNIKATTKKQYIKILSVFGGFDEIDNNYHCIECRRTHNVRRDGRKKPTKTPKKKNNIEYEIKELCIPNTDIRLQIGRTNIMTSIYYAVKQSNVSDNDHKKIIRNFIKMGINKGIFIPADKNTRDKYKGVK